MSNGDTKVNVSSEGSYHLGFALDLALQYHIRTDRQKEPTSSHWAEHDGKLVFYWHESGGGNAFVVPHTKEMLIPLIMGWLGKQDYGEEPDIDGSTHKGWCLKSHQDLMGNIPGQFYIQFTVEPAWMEYQK